MNPPPKLGEARTFLFVPANRPERITKAGLSGADFVIVDLEDAVAPSDKDNARQMLLTWLEQNPQPRLLVRINGQDTPWHDEDIQACQHPNIAGIVLPKAEKAEDISLIYAACSKPILPIIETALGLDNLPKIAATQGVSRLLFGKLDLAVELGLEPDENDPQELVFLAYRTQLVLASKLHGLPPPVDGVYTAIDDMEGLQHYTQRSKNHGFGALLLIHPRQANRVKQVFQPTEAELLWAAKVIAALEQAGGGTASVEGRMVDAPVILRAQRIIAQRNDASTC